MLGGFAQLLHHLCHHRAHDPRVGIDQPVVKVRQDPGLLVDHQGQLFPVPAGRPCGKSLAVGIARPGKLHQAAEGQVLDARGESGIFLGTVGIFHQVDIVKEIGDVAAVPGSGLIKLMAKFLRKSIRGGSVNNGLRGKFLCQHFLIG